MNDNLLVAALISAIETGLAAQSLAPMVQQAYQPQTSGTLSTPSVFLIKLHDVRYGWPSRRNVYQTGVMTHSEGEIIETTFQVEALTIQDPTNATQFTAADLVRAVERTLQSTSTIETLHSQGIGIYRIGATRQPYFLDDMRRYEASPSFDFTVNHTETISDVIPSTTTLVPSLHAFD